MSAMADFARMPTQRKVLVFVVIGALLGLLYFQFVFKPMKTDIEVAEAVHDEKQALNNKLEAEIPEFKTLKTKICQLKHIIDENQTALPSEAELPAFFETLNRKTLESGVEVRRWEQQQETKIETFVKVPVKIQLTGTFMQIKKFFASLVEKKKKPSAVPAPPPPSDSGCSGGAPIEEHERIVSIEGLKLSNVTVVNHELVLTADFTAATYRKEEEAPPPGTSPAPVVPTPTAPAAGGGAPPNAATPAGAKARTDGAMQKDDDRTRKRPETQDTNTAGSAKLKGGL